MLSIATICFNQLSDTKQVWGSWLATIQDKQGIELVVVDNGCTDGTIEWLNQFVFPHFTNHQVISNPENVGVIPALNQIWKAAKGDVVAVLHNDLLVYEQGWDQRIIKVFADNTKCGLAGFFGAEGMGANGGRINCHCNFLEAEFHAQRDSGERKVSHFDGITLIWRKEMMDEIGGMDEKRYKYHHWYDRWLSLKCLFSGWENWFIGVSCHHLNGLTANRPDYQAWVEGKMGTTGFTGDKAIYDQNERLFFEDFGAELPFII